MSDTIDAIEFLARSPNRVQLLRLLSEQKRMSKSELKAIIDGSRTTFTRNLDALEDRGWIQTTPTECSITPSGAMIADDFLDLIESMDVANRLQAFFANVAASDLDFDPRALGDATIKVSTPDEPYAPVNLHLDALKRSQTVKLVLPIMGVDAMETSRQQIFDTETIHELVVEPAIAETLTSNPGYSEAVEELLATDYLTIHTYDGSFPYYLGIFDDTVQIGGIDDDGIPRAVVESAAADVQAWADRTYQEYKQRATQLTIPEG